MGAYVSKSPSNHDQAQDRLRLQVCLNASAVYFLSMRSLLWANISIRPLPGQPPSQPIIVYKDNHPAMDESSGYTLTVALLHHAL